MLYLKISSTDLKMSFNIWRYLKIFEDIYNSFEDYFNLFEDIFHSFKYIFKRLNLLDFMLISSNLIGQLTRWQFWMSNGNVSGRWNFCRNMERNFYLDVYTI